MLGGVATIASSVRVWALWLYFNAPDASYGAINVSLWSTVHLHSQKGARRK